MYKNIMHIFHNMVILSSRHAVVERDEIDSEKCEQKSPDFENNSISKGKGDVFEPYVGMEFQTEDDVRKFYIDYATRVGFVVRVAQSTRPEKIEGGNITHCLVCNKQGISSSPKGKMGLEGKPRPGVREACDARILFKLEESGKWVVTGVFKDHDHALDLHEKDKKIHELKGELQRQEELFATHRERFISLVTDIEKQVDRHLSPKVLAIVENVKKVEVGAFVTSKA
ncbi:protei far-red impaired response 1 [Striga asiatica]|uniref:Protei far-red impaired response 1 n=1 Tax=Striga asiatica TaxID=4170 RepID=A0A5A7Q6S9_STRAF|nr:protei far-red impaired response 1 [Striga asiatica]